MKKLYLLSAPATIVLIVITLFMRCNMGNDGGITPQQSAEVQVQVQQLADNIARDVSKEGPTAWLHYFADEPQFFMASNGQLAFANYDSAKVFIQTTLVKIMPAIHLSWSNMRIDAITKNVAVIGANFQEIITDSSGKQSEAAGYFTGTAQKMNAGWQLRNAHWSIAPAK